jgi:dihydropyrimidinase
MGDGMRSTALRGWLAVGLTLLYTFLSVPLSAQDLLVHGGTVVTSEGRFAADVLVSDGIIVELGQALSAPSDVRRIDASGLLVLPGGVDPHVHLGGSRADDYRTGSMAALAGGITTISNFAFPARGQTLAQAVDREAVLIREQAMADVILHPGINDPATQEEQMSTLLEETGQASVKVFMVSASFDENIHDYLATMDAAGHAGILTMVHTEDGLILARAVEELTAQGKTSLEYFPDSRPVLGEVVAMQRAVAMAEQTGAPIYAVHVSSERALRVAQGAQARGVSVFVETRPIY